MLCSAYLFTINLWQAINKVVSSGYTEILRKVYYLDMVRHGMLLEESLALAVAEAEEDNINMAKVVVTAKAQIALSDEPLMYVAHKVAGIALAMGEDYLRLRMIKQQAYQLAARIACRSKYSYSYHFNSFDH